MSLLQKIQPFVQSTAEAMAAAMKIEVEIIDSRLVRVGGTGILAEKVRTRQERGHVSSYVLQTSKLYVIEKPGHHHFCNDCNISGKCFYTAGIFCPILLNGKAVGIISFISFDEEQRQTILANVDRFTDFITKMSDLLASKMATFKTMVELELTNEHLKTIINNIREGIFAVDNEGVISYMNLSAEKILKVNAKDVSGKLLKKYFPSSPLNDVLQTGRECFSRKTVYKLPKNTVSVVSSAYPIKLGNKIVGAVESFSLADEIQKMACQLTTLQDSLSFDDILGNSKLMQEIKEKACKIAAGSSTVLITGESGTGKEIFARAIHCESPRFGKPFVPINCSAIPDSLLESELFGYEEGAFTGAKRGGKPGKFELADGGTIFLDEIADMPLYLQAKLLRVLQEKKIERVGGLKSISVDVRIISATNKDLSDAITQGKFREDLYYRLDVIPLHLPPLRKRKEDIPCFMNFFLEKYNNLLGKNFTGFSPKAGELLMRYSWPGNVRELENVIEYACNLEVSLEIMPENFPEKLHVRKEQHVSESLSNMDLAEKMAVSVKELEKQILVEGLERFGVSVKGKGELAKHLGISLPTLYRKLKEV